VDNLEIWRSARLLIEQRGEDAVLFAAQRADELLDSGDHLGCSVWIAIGRAIKVGTPTAAKEFDAKYGGARKTCESWFAGEVKKRKPS